MPARRPRRGAARPPPATTDRLLAPHYDSFTYNTRPAPQEEDPHPHPHPHDGVLSFLNELADHINPTSTPSLFVSTFTTAFAARQRLGSAGGVVYKIDTEKLKFSYAQLWSVETMRRMFLLPGDEEGGEFLVRLIVPKGAVVGVVEVAEGEEGEMAWVTGRLADAELDTGSVDGCADGGVRGDMSEWLSESALGVREEVLRAAEVGDAERLVLVDERRTEGRRFSVPVSVLPLLGPDSLRRL